MNSTRVLWKPSPSRGLQPAARPRWREVQRGIEFILAGYLALGTLALPGVVLGLAAGGGPAVPEWLKVHSSEAEFFAPAAAVVGVLLACALGLLGQAWCLVYAPPGGRARKRLFLAILAILVSLTLSLAAPLLGAHWDLQLAARLQDAWQEERLPPLGTLFQVAAVALVLVNVLLLSQFARRVMSHLGDQARAAKAERFFLYVALLLGGSAGAFLAQRHVAEQAYLFLGLAAGWAVCVGWHVGLLVGLSRSVRAAQPRPATGRSHSGIRRPYSGVRRAYQVSLD
jgi:cytochrome bd-type quinol oxidase subunit 2